MLEKPITLEAERVRPNRVVGQAKGGG